MTAVIGLLCLILMVTAAQARDLYFVDAHSQFDRDVEASMILDRMDEGNVYKTLLASRRKRKPRESAELAEQYPDRIVASLRTKGRHYAEGTNKFYKKLNKTVRSGRFSAMAEVLAFHARKGGKADEVRVALDDRRVQAALEHAIEQGWPFVVHIEFASLEGAGRDGYLSALKTLLREHADHPFALIHMGQLPAADAATALRLFRACSSWLSGWRPAGSPSCVTLVRRSRRRTC